jgi:hypothetical protein
LILLNKYGEKYAFLIRFWMDTQEGVCLDDQSRQQGYVWCLVGGEYRGGAR